MPRLCDPDSRWAFLADGAEADAQSMTGARKHTRAGWYLRDVAVLVAEAAGWRAPTFSTDWRVLCSWLDERLDPHAVIIPTIRRVRRSAEARGEAIGSLRYFDAAVRRAATQEAASA